MKLRKYSIIVISLVTLIGIYSCNDFLDRKPLSETTPESYFGTADQLLTYTITLYPDYFNTHSKKFDAGTFVADNGTDNQAGVSANDRWSPGRWRVPGKDAGWNFEKIRKVNYFFQKVLPKYEAGKITGPKADINQAIGEIYFLRAIEYFNKLTTFGDFPIIKEVLPDVEERLIVESKRMPQNEVARFILEDLDKAASLLKPGLVSNGNRLSREAALLLKSRVALYEGTWLKYHKGTSLVPGGPGWPGANRDYLKDFSIDIDSEINYFLTQCMIASKEVADAKPLTINNHNIEGEAVFQNPYFNMFSAVSMGNFSEVILWRAYDLSFSPNHVVTYLYGGGGTGYTRDFVNTFLMKNGLPIYANSSGYHGDDYISNVREDRDERLQLFMQKPGEPIAITPGVVEAIKPDIFGDTGNIRAVTGYQIKKGMNPNSSLIGGQLPSNTGSLVFRATEAYLNYIEANYVLNSSLDAIATQYWSQLRQRAGLPGDFNITISNTDLDREEDLAKYSQGQLVDKTLYNIRRERRCELIAEGMRMNDLRRWRALDQLKTNPYIVEGFKIWGPMKEWYKNDEGEYAMVTLPDDGANTSKESLSEYLRPYQVIKSNNDFYNGFTWIEAHYYSPISSKAFQLTSKNGDPKNSIIYQNPGWPTTADAKPNGI